MAFVCMRCKRNFTKSTNLANPICIDARDSPFIHLLILRSFYSNTRYTCLHWIHFRSFIFIHIVIVLDHLSTHLCYFYRTHISLTSRVRESFINTTYSPVCRGAARTFVHTYPIHILERGTNSPLRISNYHEEKHNVSSL